jgi:amino acid adenylation domain-containing protein
LPDAVPIGRPLPNVRIYLLDESLNPVPIGTVGEIYIGGTGLARGYLNRPEATSERFVPDPFGPPGAQLYRTGDNGRYRLDGNLVFAGRRDEQLKVRGFRVEPAEIEAALHVCPGVARSVVVARTFAGSSEKHLVAYLLALDDAARPGAAELRERLRQVLPAQLIPSAFLYIDAFPLMPSGKVDRSALPDPDTHERPRLEQVAPRSPIEQMLREIWVEVLGHSDFGIHDNFFELGGHSLLATQVVSRVRHTLQVELPLRALFEAPTIATLAERAAQRRLPGAPVELRPISILPRDRPLPTSFSQRRMWLIQQLEPESTAYNMPFALRVRGPLDARALAAALAVIVQRHEAFRTRFLISNGEPMQLIAATGEDELNEVDLRHLPETERAAEAARLCGAEARRPFDLSRAPLHRFMLLRLGDADYTFLLHMHHAVSDQWSAGILARELAYLYVTFKEGKTPVLEPLRVQYADFAAWQREQIGDALLAPQLAYWRERLQGIRTLTLQTDRPRPAQQTFRGSHLSAPIPPATLAALKALGARLGATPFMTLLAAFKVLLARYCNEEDIAVGTPIANRTRIETEPLVGTLVNTLVMRTSLAGDPTFAELLGRVRDTALDAYAHQDLPFERLVEELAATRDTSHAPLVQVLFNVPNAPMGTLGFDGLDLDVFEFDAGSAQFDLSLTVDTEQFDRVSLAYSTELFDATSAQRMLDHYLMLIESVVADPERRIATFDLLSAKEKALILGDWNRTAAAYPGELRTDQLIAAQAQRTPASVAVGMGHRNVTYRQLDQRANQLAHWLTRNGASSGAIVGVHLDRSLDLVAVLLGVMKAGATYVPLDPSFPPERLQAMAIDAGLALLLTRSDLPQPVPEMSDRMLFLDQCGAQISCEPTTPPEVRTPPDALAYILYTSGSTGTPKGVEIPHRALTNFLCSMQSQPGCSAGDTMLAVTTLSFDIAALEIYLPLMAGARVELASSQEVSDGRLLRERLEACRPTIMQATPATWRMLIEAGWSGSPSLTVLCGGEGLPRDLADKLLERCSSLWNLYGPTETTVWSTQQRIEPDTAQVGIGRPIANTSVYILDKEMRPVPVGVPGEIFIGGHGVARGYRNRPELTAERFVADPFSVVPGARLYRTGDLARWLPDGRIVHLGRLDSQVKVRGFRIELGEIDSVLARHPRVAQAVTTTRCDASGVMQLVAYVVSRGAEPPSLSDLRASLRASLPEYMVPSQFVFLDALPLTANRKVDVKALPAPATARPRDAHVEPRGRLEVQLMALWRQVLGHDEVGIHDNFFDLGGHSLQAVQLMAFIEQVTGRQLPLATLFRAPTVAALARLLAQTNWTPQWRALVAIQPLGRKTPLFAIPGVGGNVLMFARLSKLLGPDQPFFGLQARGLDSTDEPFTSIVKMAAHYVGEIRSMQPSGPYIVAGTCTGGVVAYEVAQQLMKSGERVILMLLETWHPTSARRSWRLAAPVFPIRFLWGRLIMWRRALASMPLQQWPAFLAAKARNVGTSIRGVTAHDVEVPSYYPERVVRSTWHAIAHYAPIAYAGRLLNVTAGRRPLGPQAVDTRKLWEKLATGGSRTITTPAEDSGRLFVSPHVEELAGHIERYILAELSRGGSRQPPTSHEIGATMQAPPA